MNTHEPDLRLTFARQIEMVKMIVEWLTAAEAATAQGVVAPTARKWLGRYLASPASRLVSLPVYFARKPYEDLNV